jgi:mannose-1-phosphate guanylyltransferase
MKVVILCGGSGTRLWPISRTLYPKQFVKIFDNNSLFQKTVSRNSKMADSFLIVLNQEQYFMGLDQIEELNLPINKKFILEPVGRNTAPAIAIAAFSADPDELLLVVPSDHLINKQSEYESSLATGLELARKGSLVTFGIKPNYAETGYGYIEAVGIEVKSFKEKPNKATAEMYLEAGNYFWNSGMFCFKAQLFLDELKIHAPDIYEKSHKAYLNAKTDHTIRLQLDDMNNIRPESIDYAVMEKSEKVNVVPSDIGWSDLGSFDSLYDVLPKDEMGNTQSLNTIHMGSKNNLVISHDRMISTIDVEDLMIIDTQDAMVIAKKGSTQKIKDLVAMVKKNHEEITNVHTTAYRPWGTYTILEEKKGYKVKKITVRPGAKLSLQYHQFRSEHWIVVSGIASVTVDDKIFEVKENESTFIPKGSKHRLENNQKMDLILIEAQVGQYLGEDDITRLKDDYQRK